MKTTIVLGHSAYHQEIGGKISGEHMDTFNNIAKTNLGCAKGGAKFTQLVLTPEVKKFGRGSSLRNGVKI